jgi:hypothetical protein
MLLNELFEVSQDLVSRYKTAAIKDVDKAIAAKAAGTMGRDEYERKMTKRGRGTAAAQRRLTPQGTRLDLTPHGDAIQRDYDRYRTDEQGVAEGKDDKIAQLKKDHDTAVHWSKNEKSPQKREAARQKAEKIKRHLETQYKQGAAEGRTK